MRCKRNLATANKIFEIAFQLGGQISPSMHQAFNEARNAMGDMRENSGKTNKVMAAMKVAAGIAAAGIGTVTSALGAAIKTADEYNNAMNQLQASTGASAKEMAEIKNISKNLYNQNLGEDFNDLADAVSTTRQVTQLQGKDLQKVTRDALIYRDVFGEDISQSIKASDTMMKNFGITSSQSYNLLAQGAQKGLNKSDELIDSANEYAPYFSQLGFSANDMFNTFSTGLKNGAFNLDKVGDAIKEFNIRSKDGSKNTMAAYAALGLEGNKLTQTFAKGGPEAQKAFTKVVNAIGKVKDPAKQSALAVSLFGTQAEDLEIGVIKSFGHVKSQFNMAKKTMESIKDVKYDTVGQAIQGIGRKLYTGFILPIGEYALPAFQSFSNYLNASIPKVTNVIKKGFSGFKDVFKNVSAAILPFKDGIKSYLQVLGSIFSGIKNLVLTFSPYVKSAVGSIVTFIKQIFGQVATFWSQNGQQIIAAVKNVFSIITAVIKFALPFVLMIVRSIWGNIKGVITGSLNIIMGAIKIFAGLFTGDFRKMWEGIKQLFSGAIKFAWNLVNLMFYGKILGGIKALAKGSIKSIGGMWTSIKTFFSGGVKKVDEKIISLANKMRGGFGKAKNAVVGIAKEMWSGVKTHFNNIVAGAKALPGRIGKGVKSMAHKALDGVISMGNSLLIGLGKVINGVINGLKWVGKELGIDVNISNWKVPQYAHGTNGHPGGLAVLGDGGGPELYRTPNGQVGLSPGTDTMMYLPKGTQVIPHKETAQILQQVPMYAKGTGVSNAIKAGKDWVKDKASSVANEATDIFSMITSPKKMFNSIAEKFGVTQIANVMGYFKTLANGSYNFVKDGAINWLKKKTANFGANMANVSGGAKAWIPQIKLAAAQMKVDLSKSELAGIIAQINRESSGNASIIQSSQVVDVNTLNGNPARGLLQYIPQTFKAYAVKGFGDITNGYHQLLAFFNNSNWRSDLPYGKSGWGPSGGRRFANGGPVRTNDAVLVGEEGPELIEGRFGSRVYNSRETRGLLSNIKDFANKTNLGPSMSKSISLQVSYAPVVHAKDKTAKLEILNALKQDRLSFKKFLLDILKEVENDKLNVSFESL